HEGHVNIWDPSGKRIRGWGADSTNTTPRLSWSFDGKRLVNGTGASIDRIECRDPMTGKPVWEAMGHARGASSTALSPNGNTLAVAHIGQGSIRLWDLDTGRVK